MKYRVLNNGVLEFFDATANTVGSIGANGANMKITANTGVIELGNIPSDIQVGTAGTLTNWTFLGGGTIGAGGIGTISMGQSGDTVNMNVSGVLYQYPASFLRFNEISGANNKINITTQVPGSVILSLPNRPVVGQLSLTDNVPTSSNTAGTLTVAGGVGVSGNLYVGGTNAGVNGVYTDVLRYSANGLPWVMGSGGGGGSGLPTTAFSRVVISGQPDAIANIANSPLTLVAGSGITLTTNGVANSITITSTGGGGATLSGYLANTLIYSNSAGFISNTRSLSFYEANNTIVTSNYRANGNVILGNTATSNTATIRFNAALNTLDFIIG